MHQPVDFPDYLNFHHGFKFSMPCIFTCMGHPTCTAVIGGIKQQPAYPSYTGDYPLHPIYVFCWWDTRTHEFHACYNANTPEDSYL